MSNPFEDKTLVEVIRDYQLYQMDEAEEENRRKVAAYDAKIARENRQRRKEFLELELSKIIADEKHEAWMKKLSGNILAQYFDSGIVNDITHRSWTFKGSKEDE